MTSSTGEGEVLILTANWSIATWAAVAAIVAVVLAFSGALHRENHLGGSRIALYAAGAILMAFAGAWVGGSKPLHDSTVTVTATEKVTQTVIRTVTGSQSNTAKHLFLSKRTPKVRDLAGGLAGMVPGQSTIDDAPPFANAIELNFNNIDQDTTTRLVYAVPAGEKRIEGWVGQDTGGQYANQFAKPTVTFELYLEPSGERAWGASDVGFTDSPRKFDVPLQGAPSVMLQTTAIPDNDCVTLCSVGAVWANPELVP
jgi:hypothetical protein